MKLPIFKTIAEKQQAYNYKQAHSMSEIDYILRDWAEDCKVNGCNAYFRGQAEGSWKIYASSQREWLVKELDRAYMNYNDFLEGLLEYFKIDAPIFLKNKCKVVTDISIFSTIQHYGVPTPFVDWTSNLDAALYFASLGNENCVGFETDSYFSVYYLTVGKGAETPNNDLYRFSTLLESHKEEMQKVQRELGKISGSDYQEILKFNVWKEFPVIWMEEFDDEWMQIANPRSDLQGGAFVYNSDPKKSLDQIFNGQKMYDWENTEDLALPKIHCLDIHKSVLPELKQYLEEESINSGSLGLNSDNWGANFYRQFRVNYSFLYGKKL